MSATPATNELMTAWQRAARLPFGKAIFSRLLGRRVPYTGSISPRVLTLTPGYVRVAIADRRRLRNHLDSVHAAALTNLGELATGLALSSALPRSARAIPTRLSIDFLKKARGAIVAECECQLDDPLESRAYELVATLSDADRDEVARVTAHWQVGPKA